jgi:hypothetical protein
LAQEAKWSAALSNRPLVAHSGSKLNGDVNKDILMNLKIFCLQKQEKILVYLNNIEPGRSVGNLNVFRQRGDNRIIPEFGHKVHASVTVEFGHSLWFFTQLFHQEGGV